MELKAVRETAKDLLWCSVMPIPHSTEAVGTPWESESMSSTLQSAMTSSSSCLGWSYSANAPQSMPLLPHHLLSVQGSSHISRHYPGQLWRGNSGPLGSLQNIISQFSFALGKSGFTCTEQAKQPFFAGVSQCQRNRGIIRSGHMHSPPNSSAWIQQGLAAGVFCSFQNRCFPTFSILLLDAAWPANTWGDEIKALKGAGRRRICTKLFPGV